MTDTLVLNADGQPLRWMPLSTKPWREAVKHYFEDRVEILVEYDDWEIHSPSLTMAVPAIVMLREYVKPSFHVKFSRFNVFVRDDFRCQYCHGRFDETELTLDHVVPRYHGGRTTWNNVVAACHECNREKANFLDRRPRMRPVRPNYWAMVEKRKQLPILVSHPAWADFIGWPAELVVARGQRRRERENKRLLPA